MTFQHFLSVTRQRHDVVEVGVSDALAFFHQTFDGGADGTKGATPAHHEEVSVLVAVDFLQWDVVSHAVDLLLTEFGHNLVVFRIGRQVALAVFLFQTADTVTQARRARDSPFATEPFLVTAVRHVVRVVSFGQRRRDARQVSHLGDAEHFGAVAQ